MVTPSSARYTDDRDLDVSVAIRRDIHSVRDAQVGGRVEHGRLGASPG
jgi:hypothetical protein